VRRRFSARAAREGVMRIAVVIAMVGVLRCAGRGCGVRVWGVEELSWTIGASLRCYALVRYKKTCSVSLFLTVCGCGRSEQDEAWEAPWCLCLSCGELRPLPRMSPWPVMPHPACRECGEVTSIAKQDSPRGCRCSTYCDLKPDLRPKRTSSRLVGHVFL
jgi:hypothetical protein